MAMIFWILLAGISIFFPQLIERLIHDWKKLLDRAEPSRITGFLKNRSAESLYDLAMILFMTLICSAGTSVPDFANYANAYQQIGLGIPYSYLGTGWYWLMSFGQAFGMRYAQIKAIICFVSLLLIWSTLLFFRIGLKGRAFFWGTFMIFPALLDMTQIRFFAAAAIVIWGCRFLARFSFRNLVCYVLTCLLAALIHSSAAYYLLFTGIYLYRLWPKTISSLCVLGTLFGVFGKNLIITLAGLLIHSDRLDRYFLNGGGMGKGGMLFIACIFALILAVSLICTHLYQDRTSLGCRQKHLFSLVSGSAWILTFTLALAGLDANFIRIQRPGWILFLMMAALCVQHGYDCLRAGRFRISLKTIVLLMAVALNLYFITVFTFTIVSGFLL